MFAGLKRRLGLVEVSSTPKYIVVEGISTDLFARDMYRVWGNNTVFKHMFSQVTRSAFRMGHFFGPDFKYICQRILDDRQTRTPKRVLQKIIDELIANTWIGDADRQAEYIQSLQSGDRKPKDSKAAAFTEITDAAIANKLAPFPLKPFQAEFIQIFGRLVPAFGLKGYMLDAGAGSGKTVGTLVLAASAHAGKVVVVCPKPVTETVWKDTVDGILTDRRPYWYSTSGEPLTTDKHYYICHYEMLEEMVEFIKAHTREFKNTFVILDESHNFNRIQSDRAQIFIDLCQLKTVSYSVWSSGTPILALGVECIPFLKCIDPYFDADAEERFRKIYGRDAKRANDILRNRMGHLKYHVPKQDVVSTKVREETVLVKMPDGDKYTLENISVVLRKFIDERNHYYGQNRKAYEKRYADALAVFEETLKNETQRKEFVHYNKCVKIISSGFDPKTMKEEAMFANQYERKTIIPTLPSGMKNEFRSAKSVVKYVQLKIMGEALGTVVGGMRSKCHVAMVEHIDFSKYIDAALKKTLIFTSYVEVVETVAEKIFKDGYDAAKIYGSTNKDLPQIVSRFYKDPDLNPLIATYQSLSTGVPLTAADRILLLNQAFRDAIKIQTIARAARLGQDSEYVDVLNFLLDTGALPNISTRSNEILEWSQQQVASIMSVNNVDIDTLQLESRTANDPLAAWLALESAEVIEYSPEVSDFLSGLGSLLADILGISNSLSKSGRSGTGWGNEKYYSGESNMTGFEVPLYLYHGSMYKQPELMPGFKRSGELVQWDQTESNEWLYASSDRDEAIMLGISSAIEKNWLLDRYHYDAKRKEITIDTSEHFTLSDVMKLPVYLYTIAGESDDRWVPNLNLNNGILSEYKTQNTVESSIRKCEKLDLYKVLGKVKVTIRMSASEYSTEKFSDIVKNIKAWFGDGREKAKKGLPVKKWMGSADHQKVSAYLKEYFGNPNWVSKQEFNETVSGAGIVQALSYDGKFETKDPLTAAVRNIEDYKTKARKYDEWLTKMNADVQRIARNYEPKILSAISVDNKDEVEKLVNAAIAEFSKIPQPMLSMAPIKIIGSRTVAPKTYKNENSSGKFIAETEVKVTQETIKALNASEIARAVAIIQGVIGFNDQIKFYKAWLDFKDGSKFSNAIHEYDESLYMDYYDEYYHQGIEQVVIDGFASPMEVSGEVIIALLTWMDRSVK